MLTNRVLYSTTNTSDVKITGHAVDWVMRDTSALDIACSVLRCSRLPIRGTTIFNRFGLDLGLLWNANGWVSDSTNIRLQAWNEEDIFKWSISSTKNVRTQRYGSSGSEALSGLEAGSKFGNIEIDTGLTPLQFLDTIVQAEKETAKAGASKLEDWIKDRLAHLYKYAESETRTLRLVAAATEKDGILTIHSPLDVLQVATPTGIALMPSGPGVVVDDVTPASILGSALDMIDGSFENSTGVTDVEGGLRATGADEVQMTAMVNGYLSQASSDYQRVPALFGVGELDVCLWYYLASAAFKNDTSVKSILNTLSSETLAEHFLKTRENQQYVAIAK